MGSAFIDQTKNIVISFLAASVIDGDDPWDVDGHAVYYWVERALSQFISLPQATQDKISLERLNEIHEREDEEPEGSEKSYTCKTDITFKNVTFQYGGPRSRKC